jgi:PAS domain S-box-containing protein
VKRWKAFFTNRLFTNLRNNWVFLLVLSVVLIVLGAILYRISQTPESYKTVMLPETPLPLDAPLLVYGGDYSSPPYEFLDNGLPNGFIVEMIYAVGRASGFQVQVRLNAWNEVRKNFDEGKVDVIALSQTPEREKIADFTPAFIDVAHALVIRSDSPIRSLDDLKDKSVAVQKNDVMHEYLLKNRPDIHPMPVMDVPEMLKELSSGKYDAVLAFSQVQSLYLIEELNLKNLRVVDVNILPSRYSLAVAEGNFELQQKLIEGLNVIRANGRYEQIYQKWFGKYERQNWWQIASQFLLGIGILIFLLLAVTLWSRNLERLVRRRTVDLEASREDLRQFIEYSPIGVVFIDPLGKVDYVNEHFTHIFGYELADIPNLNQWFEKCFPDPVRRQKAMEAWNAQIREVERNQREVVQDEDYLMCKDGSQRIVSIRVSKINEKWVALFDDLTEQKHANRQLYLMQRSIDASESIIIWANPDASVFYANDAACRHLGVTREEMKALKIPDFDPDWRLDYWQKTGWKMLKKEGQLHFETRHKRKDGSLVPVEVHTDYFEYENQRLIFCYIADITRRKQDEEALQRINKALRMIVECNQILVRAVDEHALLNSICRLVTQNGGYRFSWIGYPNQDQEKTISPQAWHGEGETYLEEVRLTWSNNEAGLAAAAIQDKRTIIWNDVRIVPDVYPWKKAALSHGFAAAIAVPLISGEEIFGGLCIYADTTDVFMTDEIQLLEGLADDLAFGIHTIRMRKLRHEAEESLRASETMFTAIIENLPAVFLMTDTSGRVTYQNGISRLMTGNQMGLLPEDMNDQTTAQMLQKNNQSVLQSGTTVHTIESLPGLDGVQHVFDTYRFTIPRKNQEPYLGFIGVDVTALKTAESEIEQAHAELTQAYETTLDGWSHALDLRDKETEGHTQRVTTMTVRLARIMGISESSLVHIRRGALLHDIGKMGIPDRILLKPDKLTDEEWTIMRKHPQYAYDLLWQIQYLRPAIDIPFCHHERWDGTGYPRGLKGEDIPLAARIFSVVDVWDAVTSDRPYRPAWSKEEALKYIIELSGKHFDAKVVEEFVKMIESSILYL